MQIQLNISIIIFTTKSRSIRAASLYISDGSILAKLY